MHQGRLLNGLPGREIRLKLADVERLARRVWINADRSVRIDDVATRSGVEFMAVAEIDGPFEVRGPNRIRNREALIVPPDLVGLRVAPHTPVLVLLHLLQQVGDFLVAEAIDPLRLVVDIASARFYPARGEVQILLHPCPRDIVSEVGGLDPLLVDEALRQTGSHLGLIATPRALWEVATQFGLVEALYRPGRDFGPFSRGGLEVETGGGAPVDEGLTISGFDNPFRPARSPRARYNVRSLSPAPDGGSDRWR